MKTVSLEYYNTDLLLYADRMTGTCALVTLFDPLFSLAT